MKGFWKMLTGRGEKEYREQHRRFNEAIPDSYPDDFSQSPDVEERAKTHPAYSGPMANSLDAANYRRAHYMRGPQSKAEHAAFAEYQRTHDPYGRLIEGTRQRETELRRYLDERGIALPEGGKR